MPSVVVESGTNAVASKHYYIIKSECGEYSGLTRGGTAEPVSRIHFVRHEPRKATIFFPCSADRKQDWQPHPVDPYSAESSADHNTYRNT